MKTAPAFLLWLVMAAPALAADGSAPHGGEPAPHPPAASQPATEIVGFVSPMQGAGICMDGATHLVHSADGDFRLKAANPQAAKDLARVASGEERAILSGHRVYGPECVYFSVERVIRMVHD
ncbi:MAG TPA: hypothetical protein VKC56_12895 [Gallionellaceae bacterium]|nr:hypothetical protein [Gallionellaceae bacterium]